MSTKSTISYSDTHHFYREAFDHANVYLELDGAEFEASSGQVMIRIPVALWEHLRGYQVFSTDLAKLTDQELQDKVAQEVDARIKAWQEAETPQGKALESFFGCLAYGYGGDPREDQIQSGLRYLRHERDEARQIAQEIEALNEANRR